jgi:hypothetical protein
VGSNPAGRAKFLQQLQRPEAIRFGPFHFSGTLAGTLRASRMIDASDTLFACFSSVIFGRRPNRSGLQLESCRRELWIAEHQPGIEGLAYTAPVYDEVTKPVLAPSAACIASVSRCACYSEQGLAWICRRVRALKILIQVFSIAGIAGGTAE